MFRRFLVHVISSIVAFLTAAYFLDTVIVSSGVVDLLLLGLIFGLVNVLLKPILKLLFMPIIVLTLGLFLIIINAVALYVTDFLTPLLTIQGFVPLLLATLIISVVNFAIHLVFRPFR